MEAQYWPIILALIASLIAIRGDTWDSRKRRPTSVGFAVAILAMAGFIFAVVELRKNKAEEHIVTQSVLQRYIDLSVAMSLNEFAVFGIDLDGESSVQSDEELQQRFNVVEHPCGVLSDLLLSHFGVLTDAAKDIAMDINSRCDLLKIDIEKEQLDYVLTRPNDLIGEICGEEDFYLCEFVQSNLLVMELNNSGV